MASHSAGEKSLFSPTSAPCSCSQNIPGSTPRAPPHRPRLQCHRPDNFRARTCDGGEGGGGGRRPRSPVAIGKRVRLKQNNTSRNGRGAERLSQLTAWRRRVRRWTARRTGRPAPRSPFLATAAVPPPPTNHALRPQTKFGLATSTQKCASERERCPLDGEEKNTKRE